MATKSEQMAEYHKAKRESDEHRVRQAAFNIARALVDLGFDLNEENTVGTPERFAKYLLEYWNPGSKPEELLRTGFSHPGEETYKGLIAQTNIPFRTICPHHLLPVIGKAHLGYIPSDKVVGLSKLTRVVQAVGSQKPRMQETITDILADMLETELEAKGVVVIISALHMCMSGRGVCAIDVPTMTSSVRGLLRTEAAVRSEFFQLLGLSHVK